MDLLIVNKSFTKSIYRSVIKHYKERPQDSDVVKNLFISILILSVFLDSSMTIPFPLNKNTCEALLKIN